MQSRNTVFSLFWWKNIKFQIGQDMLVCPTIAKISKSSLYTFSALKAMGNRLGNSKKWSGNPKKVFRALFDSCWSHFDGKINYFRVFLSFFDDFAWSQFLGSVRARCTAAQESKKIEIAKNRPKGLQTIIECHNKVFRVHHIGLCHHTSQSIFTDFRWFWGSFGANMPYMSTLQRMACISKLGFWKNFGGRQAVSYTHLTLPTKRIV